jgi:hypothetical protein
MFLHLAVRFSLFFFGIPRSESQLKLFIFGSGRPARCSLSQSEFPRLPTRWGSSFLLAGRFRFIPTVGAPSATLDPMAFPGSAPLIDFRPSDIFSVPLTRAARSDFFSHRLSPVSVFSARRAHRPIFFAVLCLLVPLGEVSSRF